MITPTAGVTAREARPRRRSSTLLWAGQILLATVFVFPAQLKLTGSPGMVQEFGQIGAGQWMRYFVGQPNWPGRWACSHPGWPGWPPPGWPL